MSDVRLYENHVYLSRAGYFLNIPHMSIHFMCAVVSPACYTRMCHVEAFLQKIDCA